MAIHGATVVINAPVSQVYQLWTHFNDFPKFMTFVKEVTYKDEQTSHWVADIVGNHEWDAVNDNWTENKQIGWKSVDGLDNSGTVFFEDLGGGLTRLTARISYDPPAGLFGDIGEALGAGGHFEKALRQDFNNFAEMVNGAPPGALDPNSSAFLFHQDSAAAKGETTDTQEQTFTREDYTADDPHFVSSSTPPSINQAFPTDLRDDIPPSNAAYDETEIEDHAAP